MTAIPDQLSGRAAITDSRCGTCAPAPVRLALPGSRVWTCTGALFGSPDTVSGAAAFSPARAVSRMQGEAVERAAAWHGEPVAPPGRCVTDITPEFGPLAQRSGARTAVRELRPEGWAATAAVDAAAVLLGTTGWFPHGSAGLASGPAGDSADCRSAPAGDPTLGSALWELLERDAVTRWWHGELPAVRLTAPAAVEAAAGTSCRVELFSITSCCCLAQAVDARTGWRTVGAAAGPDLEASCLKAAEEAIVSLAALHRLAAAPAELLGIAADASHRYLDLPPSECTSLAHTLLALADMRFSAAIAAHLSEAVDPAFAVPERAERPRGCDPLSQLCTAGHRVWAVQLRSPETAATGSTVWRALSPTTLAPLPRSAHPDELPVPLA